MLSLHARMLGAWCYYFCVCLSPLSGQSLSGTPERLSQNTPVEWTEEQQCQSLREVGGPRRQVRVRGAERRSLGIASQGWPGRGAAVGGGHRARGDQTGHLTRLEPPSQGSGGGEREPSQGLSRSLRQGASCLQSVELEETPASRLVGWLIPGLVVSGPLPVSKAPGLRPQRVGTSWPLR